MFKFFKKKANHDAFVAAARKLMENDTLHQSLPLMSRDALKHRFIRKYFSAEEAENENMISDPRTGNAPVPFGFSHHQWRELLAEMKDGDELWTFTTSKESWDSYAGRAGISLVRNGKELSYIITKMN